MMMPHSFPPAIAPPTVPTTAIQLTLDMQWCILAVNHPGAMQLGYTAAELVGRSLATLCLPNAWPHWQAQLDARRDAPLTDSSLLIPLRHRTGQPMPFQGRLSVLHSADDAPVVLLLGEVAATYPGDRPPHRSLPEQAAQALVGIFQTDAQDQLQFISPRGRELFDPRAELDLANTKWTTLIHPDDRHWVLTDRRATLARDAVFSGQLRLQRPDQSIVWVLLQVQGVRDRQGALSGYLGAIVELPHGQAMPPLGAEHPGQQQHIQAIAQQLRESLDLHAILSTAVADVRDFLDTDRVVIFRFDSDDGGTVMVESVAPDCQPLLGNFIEDPCFSRHSAAAYEGGQVQAIADIHQADLQPCYTEMLTAFDVRAVLVVPLRQNDTLWGLLIAHHCRSARPWQASEITLLGQLAQQLSIAIQHAEWFLQLQRVNAFLERQVRKTNAQLQLASSFEATLKRITDRVRDSMDENLILQAAVQELATALGVRNCNAAVYDLERRTSTILYEHTTSLAPFQGRVVMMDNFPEGYNQLLAGQHFQFCSLQPNPKRGRVSMLACPILDDKGVLGDLWLISREYRLFNEQDIRLVQLVASQCAIALRQARLYQAAQTQVQELEKVNQLKDDFLSTVSHELRTPMTNIKMATQMLEIYLRQQHLLDGASTPLTRYFKILHDECYREIHLINDLLDLSRLESSHEPLNLSTVELPEWGPHLVAPFAERARSQKQNLEVDLPPTLPPLITDTTRLERALTELLSNACKYTPAGGSITLQAIAQPDAIAIRLCNSGIEIAPQELRHIFDKFYRVPNNDPWKHGGTGLGLALVKRLVESLQGHIQASSEAGITCFQIVLPWQPDNPTNAAPAAAPMSTA